MEIPYWWDNGKETLAATIHQIRPDLIPEPPGAHPIPLTYVDRREEQLPPLMHAQTWDQLQDLSGWQFV